MDPCIVVDSDASTIPETDSDGDGDSDQESSKPLTSTQSNNVECKNPDFDTISISSDEEVGSQSIFHTQRSQARLNTSEKLNSQAKSLWQALNNEKTKAKFEALIKSASQHVNSRKSSTVAEKPMPQGVENCSTSSQQILSTKENNAHKSFEESRSPVFRSRMSRLSLKKPARMNEDVTESDSDCILSSSSTSQEAKDDCSSSYVSIAPLSKTVQSSEINHTNVAKKDDPRKRTILETTMPSLIEIEDLSDAEEDCSDTAPDLTQYEENCSDTESAYSDSKRTHLTINDYHSTGQKRSNLDEDPDFSFSSMLPNDSALQDKTCKDAIERCIHFLDSPENKIDTGRISSFQTSTPNVTHIKSTDGVSTDLAKKNFNSDLCRSTRPSDLKSGVNLKDQNDLSERTMSDQIKESAFATCLNASHSSTPTCLNETHSLTPTCLNVSHSLTSTCVETYSLTTTCLNETRSLTPTCVNETHPPTPTAKEDQCENGRENTIPVVVISDCGQSSTAVVKEEQNKDETTNFDVNYSVVDNVVHIYDSDDEELFLTQSVFESPLKNHPQHSDRESGEESGDLFDDNETEEDRCFFETDDEYIDEINDKSVSDDEWYNAQTQVDYNLDPIPEERYKSTTSAPNDHAFLQETQVDHPEKDCSDDVIFLAETLVDNDKTKKSKKNMEESFMRETQIDAQIDSRFLKGNKTSSDDIFLRETQIDSQRDDIFFQETQIDSPSNISILKGHRLSIDDTFLQVKKPLDSERDTNHLKEKRFSTDEIFLQETQVDSQRITDSLKGNRSFIEDIFLKETPVNSQSDTNFSKRNNLFGGDLFLRETQLPKTSNRKNLKNIYYQDTQIDADIKKNDDGKIKGYSSAKNTEDMSLFFQTTQIIDSPDANQEFGEDIFSEDTQPYSNSLKYNDVKSNVSCRSVDINIQASHKDSAAPVEDSEDTMDPFDWPTQIMNKDEEAQTCLNQNESANSSIKDRNIFDLATQIERSTSYSSYDTQAFFDLPQKTSAKTNVDDPDRKINFLSFEKHENKDLHHTLPDSNCPEFNLATQKTNKMDYQCLSSNLASRNSTNKDTSKEFVASTKAGDRISSVKRLILIPKETVKSTHNSYKKLRSSHEEQRPQESSAPKSKKLTKKKSKNTTAMPSDKELNKDMEKKILSKNSVSFKPSQHIHQNFSERLKETHISKNLKNISVHEPGHTNLKSKTNSLILNSNNDKATFPAPQRQNLKCNDTKSANKLLKSMKPGSKSRSARKRKNSPTGKTIDDNIKAAKQQKLNREQANIRPLRDHLSADNFKQQNCEDVEMPCTQEVMAHGLPILTDRLPARLKPVTFKQSVYEAGKTNDAGNIIPDKSSSAGSSVQSGTENIITDKSSSAGSSVQSGTGNIITDKSSSAGSSVQSAAGNIITNKSSSAGSSVQSAAGYMITDKSSSAGSSVQSAARNIITDKSSSTGSSVQSAAGNIITDKSSSAGSSVQKVSELSHVPKKSPNLPKVSAQLIPSRLPSLDSSTVQHSSSPHHSSVTSSLMVSNSTTVVVPSDPGPATAAQNALISKGILKQQNRASDKKLTVNFKESQNTVHTFKSAPNASSPDVPLLKERPQPNPENINFAIYRILNWNFDWLETYDKAQTQPNKNKQPPPLMGTDSQYSRLRIYYETFNEYLSITTKLLLLEVWESIYQDWKEKRFSNTIKVHLTGKPYYKDDVSENKKNCPLLFLQVIGFVPMKDRYKAPAFGDLLRFKSWGLPKSSKTADAKWNEQLAFVTAALPMGNNKRWLKENYPFFDKDSSVRTDDIFIFKLTLNIDHKVNFFNVKLMEIEKISNLRTTHRQLSALSNLPNNPLCQHLLFPKDHNVFFHEPVNPDQLLLQKMNTEQAHAITKIRNAVVKAEKKIFFLQGPAGTGKTHTILALIHQILLSTAFKARICLATPSNAAVDEIARRIIQFSQNLKEKKLNSISVVRVGNKDCIHPIVKPYFWDTLIDGFIRKEKNKQLPSSLIKEYQSYKDRIHSLQRILTDQSLSRAQRVKSKDDLEEYSKKLKLIENEFCVNKQPTAREKYQAKCHILDNAHVICGTLSSFGMENLKDILLRSEEHRHKNQTFTCLIIDEATQAIEVDSLIPLQYKVTKVVLVGDHKQLPATVKSQKANELALGRSLFERMNDCLKAFSDNPTLSSSIMMLTRQYRMHPEILSLPNQLFYDGKLETDMTVYSRQQLLTPYLVFDIKASKELNSDRSISNVPEAICTAQLCLAVMKVLKKTKETIDKHIGIICPYAEQRQTILEQLRFSNLDKIEVNTVDGYQGKEKEVIIMSCVRAQSHPTSIG